MPIAPVAAILEALRTLPPRPAARDAAAARAQPQDWRAPDALGRGRLIDLVV